MDDSPSDDTSSSSATPSTSSSSSSSDEQSPSSDDSQSTSSSSSSSSQFNADFESIYELSQAVSAPSTAGAAAQQSTIAFTDTQVTDDEKVRNDSEKTDTDESQTTSKTEQSTQLTKSEGKSDSEEKKEERTIMDEVLAFVKRCFAPPGFIVGIFTGMAAMVLLIFVPTPGSRDALLRQKVTLFDVILHDIDDSYVEKVDINRLFETGVNSMLGSLDPYTQFENNAQAVEMSVKTNGRYAGVGLGLTLGEPSSSNNNKQITGSNSGGVNKGNKETSNQLLNKNNNNNINNSIKEKDTEIRPIIVMSAFEGYAFDAGVRPGDIIQSVGGKSVTGVSLERVTEMLRGEPGTQVAVTVQREGFPQPLSFTLSRKDVQIRDVPASSFVGDPAEGIAYIRLQSFAKDAAAEVRAAIDALEATGHPIQGLVLDLRGNPGGLLNAAIDVAELFVPKDSTIVSTRGRGLGPSPTYVSSKEPRLTPTTRLAVLVNGQTASASEIIAGAVQDLDIGVVVGSRTFGKGLVQNVQDLPYNTALKYTVGKYYTPSGRCIQSLNYAQAEGESSQFEMRQIEESQRKEFRTRMGRVVRDGGGIEPDVEATKRPSSLEIALHKQNMYFQFATRFGAQFKLEVLPDDFEVNESIYKDFVRFVSESGFKYESRFDEAFEELDEMLKDFGYDASRTRLSDLRRATNSEMRSDFIRHEHDIRAVLESAIRFRFQPDSKRIVADLKNDEQLRSTIEVLKNKDLYDKLLRASNTDETVPGTPLTPSTAAETRKDLTTPVLSSPPNQLPPTDQQDEDNSGTTTTTTTIDGKVDNNKIS